tara:strand:+ start:56 stop:394 length:339 start_codon:yes stop_codon:yes gene_type:complete
MNKTKNVDLVPTIQLATDDGVFTLIVNYNLETGRPDGEFALKVQEDALSDNMYIDNSNWLCRVFFANVYEYYMTGYMPMEFILEFSEDVLLSISKNKDQLNAIREWYNQNQN